MQIIALLTFGCLWLELNTRVLTWLRCLYSVDSGGFWVGCDDLWRISTIYSCLAGCIFWIIWRNSARDRLGLLLSTRWDVNWRTRLIISRLLCRVVADAIDYVHFGTGFRLIDNYLRTLRWDVCSGFVGDRFCGGNLYFWLHFCSAVLLCFALYCLWTVMQLKGAFMRLLHELYLSFVFISNALQLLSMTAWLSL